MKTLIFILVILSAAAAEAHPGRLDRDGCHHVTKDFRYKDGSIAKAGTYHCHRGLGAMKLDGKESLAGPDADGEEIETPPAKEKAKDAK
jgi:hypothetical protein